MDRQHFCEFLRTRRDAAELSLDDISRVTRIPRGSLEHLEAGRFEKLPGDVFVRGFLRSYAGCIGLDAEETVRAYTSCGELPPSPASQAGDTDAGASAEETALEAPISAIETPGDGEEEGDGPSAAALGAESAEDKESAPLHVRAAAAAEVEEESAAGESGERRTRVFLPPTFAEESRAGGSLTVAVILLVIVATLTMTYLLRRPTTAAVGFTSTPPRPALVWTV